MRLSIGHRILVTSFDALGDLVLRQPLLSALLGYGEVGVAGKASSLVLLDYLVPGARALPLASGADEFETILAFAPDLVICPLKNPTRTDIRLFERLQATERVAVAAVPVPEMAAAENVTRRRDEIRKLSGHLVDVPEWEAETVAYQVLWQALTGSSEALPRPRLTLPAEALRESAGVLIGQGLTPGKFALLCPSATSNVPFKKMEPQTVAAVAVELEQRQGLPVLLAGTEAESVHVRACAELCRESGVEVRTWFGSGSTLPVFLGIIAHARVLIGIDSGSVHFAAALGVRVAGVYGGYHPWRFLPESDTALVLYRSLPCYGCGCECWLATPLCLQIDPRHVAGSVGSWLERGAASRELLPQPAPPGEAERLVVRQARETVRTINADREARLHALEEAHRAARDLYRQLAEANADREARLHALEEAHRTARDLYRQLAEANADREARLHALEEAHRTARDLYRQLAEANADREARLHALEEAHRTARDLYRQLAEANADREVRLQVICELQRDLTEVSQQLADANANAAERHQLILELECAQAAAGQRIAVLEHQLETSQQAIASEQRRSAELAAELARRRRVFGVHGYELSREVPGGGPSHG